MTPQRRNASPCTPAAWRRRAALLVAGALAALAAASCGSDHRAAPAADAPALRVSLATVESRPWPDAVAVTGTVEPWRRATPGTVLLGRVDAVLRREGDEVAAGAVLARVESREVAARLAQAEAGVAGARAAEQNARLMRERMERLLAKNAAAQRSVDDAVAAHEAARAQLDAAAEGVNAARMYRSYSEVTAPFAGTLVERRVEAGDMAAPGVPLFTIEDLSRVKIEAPVAESLVAGVVPQGRLTVEIPAVSPVPLDATVLDVLPAADPRSRTFTLRVALDNPGRLLRSGMFARLRLAGAERPALAVPEPALVRRGPLTGVFVADASSVARLRWITIGGARDGQVEVLTGLAAGERVVVAPPAELADGRAIAAL